MSAWWGAPGYRADVAVDPPVKRRSPGESDDPSVEDFLTALVHMVGAVDEKLDRLMEHLEMEDE